MLEDLDQLDAAVNDTTVFGRVGGRRPGSAAARVQVVALPVRVRDVRRLASATEHRHRRIHHQLVMRAAQVEGPASHEQAAGNRLACLGTGRRQVWLAARTRCTTTDTSAERDDWSTTLICLGAHLAKETPLIS